MTTERQPTDQELKEFWKKCGFKYDAAKPEIAYTGDPSHSWYCGGQWKDLQGNSCRQPALDLNNLFRWAVPKLNKKYGYAVCLDQEPGSLKWYCQLVMPNCSVAETYRLCPSDPVLTLFRVCQEVLHD